MEDENNVGGVPLTLWHLQTPTQTSANVFVLGANLDRAIGVAICP